MFLFEFYLSCYSSFTLDNCYMYLSFSLFHFINMSVVNAFLYEQKQQKNKQKNICWSWRRLQSVFNVTILRLPRCLEDVLEDEKLLRWRRLQDVWKTCLEDVLKTCLEDVLKTFWRQTKYLLGISVFRKSILHLSYYN